MSRGLSLAPCGLVIERIESGKRIQVLRMPVSPSGRRFRCGAVAAVRVRNTVSASGNGMLPTKWTIGLCVAAALIAVISPREVYPFDIVECNPLSGAIVEHRMRYANSVSAALVHS